MDIEELELSSDIELEEIEKLLNKQPYFRFPAISLGDRWVSMNRHAIDSGIVPDFIKWFVTTDYVIGLPGKQNEPNAFKVSKRSDSNLVAFFPTVLKREKKLKPGVYKLMKYKNGFAFKRYEPVDLSKI